LFRICVSTVLALGLLGTAAEAAIISSLRVQVIGAPVSILPDVLESDQRAFVFFEGTHAWPFAGGNRIDAIFPGAYDANGDLGNFNLPQGTMVESYYFSADQNPDVGQGGDRIRGFITFNSDILGVIKRINRLDNTHGPLGSGVTLYPLQDQFNNAWDLELGDEDSGADAFAITPDLRTLIFSVRTANNADQLRILTAPAAVPEPGTIVLMGLGLAGLGALRLRR
jgi:hypothetical protein